MRRKILLPIVICSVVFLAVFPAIFGPYWTNVIFREWGPVETASAILWLFASVIGFANCNITIKTRLLFGLTFVLFALRELGFQKRFTDGTFIKTNYYEDISGVSHYFIGALAVVLIAIIAAAAIVSALNLRRDVLPGVAPRWLVAGWALLVVSKILDRTPAKLSNDMGVELERSVTQTLMTLEEGLEFLVPIIMFGVFWTRKNIFARMWNRDAAATVR